MPDMTILSQDADMVLVGTHLVLVGAGHDEERVRVRLQHRRHEHLLVRASHYGLSLILRSLSHEP